MKINQVEELVGITKKNIRFYEAQGLLSPERNPENGSREYTADDVEQLKRVKLLRKLDVPCEQIRRVITGGLSLESCMLEQQKALEKRSHDFLQMREICLQLADRGVALDSLDASGVLDQMKVLEKGGVKFVDTNQLDVKKRRWGAWASAIVSILFFAAMICIILWANHEDPLPVGVLVFVLLIPAGVMAGIALALYQRIKELKGGELDEAGKY